ncbi:MAG: zinc-binding dehydrogenase [Dermatophilaceae bacterium]
MRALQATRLTAQLDALQVVELPDPRPARGEVLVRVGVAPVNPADVMQLSGTYIVHRDPPFVPGLVGVGTVVDASRAGLLGRALHHRRVAFAVPGGQLGTWAQLAAAPARLCVPVSATLSDEDAVNLLANATTAIGLLSDLKRAGHRAVLVTAAASEVGRMMISAAPGFGLGVVAVVRSDAQADVVRELGVVDIVDQRHPQADTVLSAVAARHEVSAAIDAVAGPMTDRLMTALPDRSTVWVLGQLSGEPVSFDAMSQLIGRGHALRGFNVNTWFSDQSPVRRLRAASQAQRLLRDGYRTTVSRRLSLDDAAADLASHVATTTAGKTVIQPHGPTP